MVDSQELNFEMLYGMLYKKPLVGFMTHCMVIWKRRVVQTSSDKGVNYCKRKVNFLRDQIQKVSVVRLFAI